jgi:hypothetical protein
MQREKEPPGPPNGAWLGRLWQHVGAVGVLCWLAVVYWKYFPQFYGRFLP